jgi:hypothetical protein
VSSRQRKTRCAKNSSQIAGKDHVALTLLTSAEALRGEFNRLNLHERLQAGEFTRRVIDTRRVPRDDGDSREISTMSNWIDKSGQVIATVHEWFDKDGEPAASKRPDPKWIGATGIGYAFHDPATKELPVHDYQELTSDEMDHVSASWPHRDTSTPNWCWRCANCGRYWLELRNSDGTGWHMESADLVGLLIHEHSS